MPRCCASARPGRPRHLRAPTRRPARSSTSDCRTSSARSRPLASGPSAPRSEPPGTRPRRGRGRAARTDRKRATDEELGYYSTEDSFTSIISDARNELSNRLRHAQEHPVAKRVSDLIDGLDELASKLDRKDR